MTRFEEVYKWLSTDVIKRNTDTHMGSQITTDDPNFSTLMTNVKLR